MWEKIKVFLAGFASAVVAIGCFLLGRKNMVHTSGSGADGERLGDCTDRIERAEDAVQDGLSILRAGKKRAEKGND